MIYYTEEILNIGYPNIRYSQVITYIINANVTDNDPRSLARFDSS